MSVDNSYHFILIRSTTYSAYVNAPLSLQLRCCVWKKAKRKRMQHHFVLQDHQHYLSGNDQCFTKNGLQPAYSGGQGGLPGWAVTWARSILCGKAWHGALQGKRERSGVLLWSSAMLCWQQCWPRPPEAQGCTLSSKSCHSVRLISFIVVLFSFFFFVCLGLFWANREYHCDPHTCMAWRYSLTAPVQSLM